MVANGQSSRSEYKVLHFLREKSIHLFLNSPDTIAKNELLPSFQTIKCEGFITILGGIWDKRASEYSIINAAKRVGISKDGLIVDNMQQDKFQQAANLIAQNQEQGSYYNAGPSTQRKACTFSSTNVSQSTVTPHLMSKLVKQNCHYGSSRDFWKSMYDQSQAIIQKICEKSLNLEEMLDLLTINKVKPEELPWYW